MCSGSAPHRPSCMSWRSFCIRETIPRIDYWHSYVWVLGSPSCPGLLPRWASIGDSDNTPQWRGAKPGGCTATRLGGPPSCIVKPTVLCCDSMSDCNWTSASGLITRTVVQPGSGTRKCECIAKDQPNRMQSACLTSVLMHLSWENGLVQCHMTGQYP